MTTIMVTFSAMPEIQLSNSKTKKIRITMLVTAFKSGDPTIDKKLIELCRSIQGFMSNIDCCEQIISGRPISSNADYISATQSCIHECQDGISDCSVVDMLVRSLQEQIENKIKEIFPNFTSRRLSDSAIISADSPASPISSSLQLAPLSYPTIGAAPVVPSTSALQSSFSSSLSSSSTALISPSESSLQPTELDTTAFSCPFPDTISLSSSSSCVTQMQFSNSFSEIIKGGADNLTLMPDLATWFKREKESHKIQLELPKLVYKKMLAMLYILGVRVGPIKQPESEVEVNIKNAGIFHLLYFLLSCKTDLSKAEYCLWVRTLDKLISIYKKKFIPAPVPDMYVFFYELEKLTTYKNIDKKTYKRTIPRPTLIVGKKRKRLSFPKNLYPSCVQHIKELLFTSPKMAKDADEKPDNIIIPAHKRGRPNGSTHAFNSNSEGIETCFDKHDLKLLEVLRSYIPKIVTFDMRGNPIININAIYALWAEWSKMDSSIPNLNYFLMRQYVINPGPHNFMVDELPKIFQQAVEPYFLQRLQQQPQPPLQQAKARPHVKTVSAISSSSSSFSIDPAPKKRKLAVAEEGCISPKVRRISPRSSLPSQQPSQQSSSQSIYPAPVPTMPAIASSSSMATLPPALQLPQAASAPTTYPIALQALSQPFNFFPAVTAEKNQQAETPKSDIPQHSCYSHNN